MMIDPQTAMDETIEERDNWRAIATELAEALRQVQLDWLHRHPATKPIRKMAKDAYAKYRRMADDATVTKTDEPI